MKKSILLLALVFAVSCKDDDDPVSTVVPDTPISKIRINEIQAKGSDFINEFGKDEDWVEIYNPLSEAVVLPANKIYFSDDISEPTKYKLTKDVTIDPKGYVAVFCDDSNRVQTYIHTSFKLSATGESFAIYYKDESSSYFIDKVTFAEQTGEKSWGRYTDGLDNWEWLVPTPLKTNTK